LTSRIRSEEDVPALIRVVVVSDTRLFCDGIIQWLSGQADLIVTACDPEGRPSLPRLAADHDVILLDAQSVGAWPRTATIPDGSAVVLVGAPDDDVWAAAALSAGARGILTRSATRDDVVNAVHVAAGGSIWARRRWLNACVRRVAGDERRRLATRDVFETRLSRREREVLRLAATGISNKDLAAHLAISEATVKVHLTRIFQKLGISSRAALAAAYHGVRPTA
jgi:DNA-binding NarL/FixJ family response regulator